MNIWLLAGGPSSEHEVSLSSGGVVCAKLNLRGRRVRPVVVTRENRWAISERVLEGSGGGEDSEAVNGGAAWLKEFFLTDARRDGGGDVCVVDVGVALARMLDEEVACVLPIFHGEFGEDGRIQGMFDTAGIPYIGSGVLASAVALHKRVALATFARAGLRVPRGVVVSRENWRRELGDVNSELRALRLPVFAKPVRGGSSIGVSLVKTAGELEGAIAAALDLDEEALVEERVVGKEVSCGVIDLVKGGRAVSTPLPPTLIEPVDAEFFTYEAKYVAGKSRDTTPAPLPPETIARIQVTALAAHRALSCEGMSRTDMIVSPNPGDEPVVLELQTIPGLTPTSLLPQQCAAVGIDFPAFLDLLIAHALHRAGK